MFSFLKVKVYEYKVYKKHIVLYQIDIQGQSIMALSALGIGESIEKEGLTKFEEEEAQALEKMISAWVNSRYPLLDIKSLEEKLDEK